MHPARRSSSTRASHATSSGVTEMKLKDGGSTKAQAKLNAKGANMQERAARNCDAVPDVGNWIR
jgi:hypothetical protein